MAGAGVASTTASASTAWPPVEMPQPPPARWSRSAGADSRTSTPRSRRLRRERLHQRRHAALERPEERGPVGVRRGDLGPERPHETAAALGGRQERREGRRGGHVVDRARVDAADEGVDQDVDHLVPQLAGHQGPDGTVADRPPDVGARQHGVTGQAEHAREAEDAAASGGPEPGRDAQRVPFGQRAQAPPGPHRRAARRDRHQRVAEPDLAAQLDRLGPAPEETVGAHVDGASRRATRCATGRRGAAMPRATHHAWRVAAGARTLRSAPRPLPAR